MAQENCLKLLSKLEDTNVIVFTNYKYWIQFSRSLGLYVITNVKYIPSIVPDRLDRMNMEPPF